MVDPVARQSPGLPAQPMLLPYLLPVRAEDGTICILSPEQNVILPLPKSFTRVIDQALAKADGTRTVPQIVQAVRTELGNVETEAIMLVLRYLLDQRMLVDGATLPPAQLDEDYRARWERNFSFFMPFEKSSASRYDYQVALKQASVVLLGLGGTGSWVAYNLALAGIGKIVGIDYAQVSASDLNRQVLYRPADVGKLKVDAAAQALALLSPTMEFQGIVRRIESESDLAQLIRGHDLFALTADEPQGLILRWSNAACFAERIPLLTLGLQGYRALVGPLYVPGVTGCWACVDTTRRRRSKYYDETFDALATHRLAGQPSIAPTCSLAGGLAAFEAIKYLAGFARPTILAREMRINTMTMQTEWRKIAQRSDCPVCHLPPNAMPRLAAQMPQARRRNLLARLLNRW